MAKPRYDLGRWVRQARRGSRDRGGHRAADRPTGRLTSVASMTRTVSCSLGKHEATRKRWASGRTSWISRLRGRGCGDRFCHHPPWRCFFPSSNLAAHPQADKVAVPPRSSAGCRTLGVHGRVMLRLNSPMPLAGYRRPDHDSPYTLPGRAEVESTKPKYGAPGVMAWKGIKSSAGK